MVFLTQWWDHLSERTDLCLVVFEENGCAELWPEKWGVSLERYGRQTPQYYALHTQTQIYIHRQTNTHTIHSTRVYTKIYVNKHPHPEKWGVSLERSGRRNPQYYTLERGIHVYTYICICVYIQTHTHIHKHIYINIKHAHSQSTPQWRNRVFHENALEGITQNVTAQYSTHIHKQNTQKHTNPHPDKEIVCFIKQRKR